MTIRPEAAELFQADGQAEITMLIVAFRNVANTLKIAALHIVRFVPYNTSYDHPKPRKRNLLNLMFIGPCVIVIVEE